jgi:hypothetical protein
MTTKDRNHPMRLLTYATIIGFFSAFAATLCFGQGYGSTYQVDVAFPLGVFSESFKTGYGGHVEFYMESESYLRLSLLLGYTRWGVDNEEVNQKYKAEGGIGSLQLEGSTQAFPILVGAKLLSPEGGVRFYGLVEVGVYLYSGKVTGQKVDENGTPIQNIYEDRSKSVAGANLGAGVLFPLSSELSLDLGGRYHFVKRDAYYNYDIYGNAYEVSSDHYMTIALGITYRFSTNK